MRNCRLKSLYDAPWKEGLRSTPAPAPLKNTRVRHPSLRLNAYLSGLDVTHYLP
jgi:hypothetical protein